MQTVTLNIEDEFYTIFPQELIVSSTEEVKQKAYQAEEKIENGEYLTQDEYKKVMDAFLKTL